MSSSVASSSLPPRGQRPSWPNTDAEAALGLGTSDHLPGNPEVTQQERAVWRSRDTGAKAKGRTGSVERPVKPGFSVRLTGVQSRAGRAQVTGGGQRGIGGGRQPCGCPSPPPLENSQESGHWLLPWERWRNHGLDLL